MRTSRIVVLAGVALALVGLLAFSASAFTADDDGGGPPWRHGGWGMWRDHGGPDPARVRAVRADLAADLATELQTSPERVEAALRGVAEQRVDEAVADGRVDAADVDDIMAAYDDGDLHGIVDIVKDGWTASTDSS